MAQKLTRKEFLKGGLAGGAAVAALPFANSVAFASEDGGPVAVHVHGTVSLGPDHFEINVDAAGRKNALSGSGWDTDDADLNSAQPNFCFYAQRGTLTGKQISLHGAVLYANTATEIGQPVKTTANLKTGEIIWKFGTDTFQGTGTVTKIEG
jgi:hypothetical protein